MDLNISADEAIISSNTNTRNISVSLSGIHERDLLNKEVIRSIGMEEFINEFGAKEVLEFLEEYFPEVTNKNQS